MSPALTVTTPRVHRPVQYLGSKMRVLPELVAAINQGGDTQKVWDPFTGTSVVAQALAGAGHQVVAADALLTGATFATALLGVGRKPTESRFDLAESIIQASQELPVPAQWDRWLRREQSALERLDGAELLRLGAMLPQTWRADWGSFPPPSSSLLSDTYAGTYFGLRQALRLERLRSAVDAAAHNGARLSDWSRAVVTTAICGAASQAVFSAGKHFAQPHKVSATKNLGFHARRILSDRAIDIDDVFRNQVHQIARLARVSSEGHSAYQGQVEQPTSASLQNWGVTTVYADPPYTAQQYSRFYHLLETIVAGHRAPLQEVRGRVTIGLYPKNRYLSPFCSRRSAPIAFARLATICAGAGARLVLSYSGSAEQGTATGNARSISLRELVACLSQSYARVAVTELKLGYRQFNSTNFEVSGRGEKEYLIVGEGNAR